MKSEHTAILIGVTTLLSIENYLKKGSEVAVQGKLVNRSYESNGEKKYVTEISLNELLMLDKKQ